jgi:hypothetical protein
MGHRSAFGLSASPVLIVLVALFGSDTAPQAAERNGGVITATSTHEHSNSPGSITPDDQRAAKRAAMFASPDDRSKHNEHQALLGLAPGQQADVIAQTSGRWLDPATWTDGKLPEDGDRVLIPEGISVTIDGQVEHANLEWVRVDGRLAFAPHASTLLSVTTLLIGQDGLLEVGTQDERVAENVTARIEILPRPDRDRVSDPFDLAGGVLSAGIIRMYGATKTAYVFSRSHLAKGTKDIESEAAAEGWRVGDRLLFPGVDPDQNQDEIVEVAALTPDRLHVALSKPLAYDHSSPFPNSIPVSNLTRNVRVYSSDTSKLGSRGHVMVMHRQTGTVFDGVSFEDLGRTDATVAQTIPRLDSTGNVKEGSDANTIGRYALHFHIRSGADIEVPPNIVRNCVITGSPKHGLVNHGGNVLAEKNIGYQNAGSHFFAENGSEIGAFIGNVAVRSAGSGERIRARDMIYDFGHGGHGFWTQSGGVRIAGNFAFGHPQGAFVIFGYPFFEEKQTVFFEAHNIGNPSYADSLGHVLISNVNFTFEDNTAAGSNAGLEIWNHKIYTNHDETSLVQNFRAWNVRQYGVFTPYVKNVAFNQINLVGGGKGTGFVGNTMTENFSIHGIDVSGFETCVVLPRRGGNSFSDARLNCPADIEIASANKPGRTIEIGHLVLDHPQQPSVSLRQRLAALWRRVPVEAIQPIDFRFRDLLPPENGDIAMLFEDDHILWSDGANTRRLLFPSQIPTANVFGAVGPAVLRGMTADQIHEKFGLAVGGQLAPADAKELPQSNGWASSDPAVCGDLHHTKGDMARSNEIYPMASRHFEQSPQNVTDRWKIVEDQSPKLVYASHEPPKFHFLPGLIPFEIHPDDIQYGYRIMGFVASRVGDKISLRAFAKEFDDLKKDPDGFVRVSFTVKDMAGNELEQNVALRVTDQAVRRGANINFFVQKPYCGACGYDTLYADVAKMFDAEGKVSFFTE